MDTSISLQIKQKGVSSRPTECPAEGGSAEGMTSEEYVLGEALSKAEGIPYLQ